MSRALEVTAMLFAASTPQLLTLLSSFVGAVLFAGLSGWLWVRQRDARAPAQTAAWVPTTPASDQTPAPIAEVVPRFDVGSGPSIGVADPVSPPAAPHLSPPADPVSPPPPRPRDAEPLAAPVLAPATAGLQQPVAAPPPVLQSPADPFAAIMDAGPALEERTEFIAPHFDDDAPPVVSPPKWATQPPVLAAPAPAPPLAPPVLLAAPLDASTLPPDLSTAPPELLSGPPKLSN